MSFKPICGGDTYQVGDDGIIILPTPIEGLPDTIDVNGKTLKKRSEFHVTLVYPQALKEKYPELPDVETLNAEVQKLFCEYVRGHPIAFAGFTDEFRLVSRGEQQTLIVRADVSNLGLFCTRLSEHYGMQFTHPPTHITLYTTDGERGIALIDEEDMQNMAQAVQNPGIQLS